MTCTVAKTVQNNSRKNHIEGLIMVRYLQERDFSLITAERKEQILPKVLVTKNCKIKYGILLQAVPTKKPQISSAGRKMKNITNSAQPSNSRFISFFGVHHPARSDYNSQKVRIL